MPLHVAEMNMSKLVALCALLGMLALVGCDASTPDPNVETAKTGKITLYVDAEIEPLIKRSIDLFRKQFPYASVTIKSVTARECVSTLFAQQAKGVIIARDLLADESTILADQQQTFPRTHFATDALVFFAAPSFPSDTINADEIRSMLRGQGTVKGVKAFVTTDVNASVYGNIVNVVLGGEAPTKNITSLPGVSAIRERVASDPSLVGIGYLSQLHGAKDVKLLRIGFTDSTGAHVLPKPVHQAYVVQGKYPFSVPLYFYLKDRPSMYNLASGISGFIYQESAAQRTFLDAGIVPEFAKIVLVPEDQE